MRAKQTAMAYEDESNINIDARLSEIGSGSWEGKSQEDETIKHERDIYKALPVEERYVAKRGGNGESWQDLESRVKEFIEEVVNKHSGQTVACFAHQGTNEIALKILKNLSNEKAANLFHEIDNGEVFVVYVDNKTGKELDLHRPFIDDVVLEKDGRTYTRVKEVMDVWFDSGAMPFAQVHYPFEGQKGGLFKKDTLPYPADFISEAVDQTRGWFYTLHAVGVLMGRGRAYKNCICLGHILDAQGKKMSKSIGNIVNPWEMMDKYGVDTLRLWMYSVNQPGDSKNFDEKTVAELRNKVFNLFYNVLAFYELYRDQSLEEGDTKSENVLDVWIMARFQELTNSMTESLDSYKLLEPVRALRDFIDDLSTWYLRRSRDRLKDGDAGAKKTLYYVLKNTAKLMAPFAPFAAEDIWQKLKNSKDVESVHLAQWPETEKINSQIILAMSNVRELCTIGNALRKNLNIPLKQPLAFLFVPQVPPDSFQSIIKEELNVKEVKEGKEVSFDTNITPELKREGDFREFLRGVQGLRKDANLSPNELVILAAPESNKELIKGFEDELKKTAGLKEIKFGGEEIKIEK